MSTLKRITWQALILCAMNLGFPQVFAEPNSFYRQGFQHFAKGEYDKAVLELQKALTQKPARLERAKTHKYLGLSLYALGRQAEAEENFEQCLALVPSCRLAKREVKEETVLTFFRDLKKRFVERKTALKPKTRIVVRSSIEEAEILMGDDVIGPVNTSLVVKPGIREITVRSKGYKTEKVKVAINKMVENIYEIELQPLPGRAAKRAREKARQESLAEKELLDDSEATVEGERSPETTDVKPVATAPVPAAPPAPPAPAVELTREPISVAHFLPFGVGQFYNSDYLLGSILLGAQAFAIQVIVVDTQDIRTARKNATAASLEVENDPEADVDDINNFITTQNDLIKKKQKEINLTIGLAAGSYVFGILHAISTRPLALNRSADQSLVPAAPAEALSFHLNPAPGRGLKLEMQWNF